MKKHFLTFATMALLTACGGGTNNNNTTTDSTTQEEATTTAPAPSNSAPEPDFPDWQNNKGIGPVKTITPPLADTPDATMAAKGEETFNTYCTVCHRPKKRLTGPAMIGLLDRRTPEWVMNMILNPDVMEKQDPIAKKLVEEYNTLMLNQRLNEQQAREVLEYIRTIK